MRLFFAGDRVGTLLLVCTLGVWMIIEIRQALHRRKEARNRDRGSLIIVRLSAAAGIVVAALARKVTATAFPVNTFGFGISICLIWLVSLCDGGASGRWDTISRLRS
jgi:hypothetical protein